jgi:hypothetical protein
VDVREDIRGRGRADAHFDIGSAAQMASEDERVALADDRARTNGGGVGQVNSSGESLY